MTRAWRGVWDDFTLWLGLLGFAPEIPFGGVSGKRRWRWDFARSDVRVAVEYDGTGRGKGAEAARGGHETRRGLVNDAEKSVEGQLCGWLVIRCHAPTIGDGRCHGWIESALALQNARVAAIAGDQADDGASPDAEGSQFVSWC